MRFDLEKCGQRIAKMRSSGKYTQEQLADALGIDRSFLSRVEAGKKGLSIDLYIQISEIFDISLDYLITGRVTNTDTRYLKENIDILICQLQSLKDEL